MRIIMKASLPTFPAETNPEMCAPTMVIIKNNLPEASQSLTHTHNKRTFASVWL